MTDPEGLNMACIRDVLLEVEKKPECLEDIDVPGWKEDWIPTLTILVNGKYVQCRKRTINGRLTLSRFRLTEKGRVHLNTIRPISRQ